GPVSGSAEHQDPAATEALGLPVRLIGSAGQRNGIAFAHDLVDGFEADAAIADKGYDAGHLCSSLAQTVAEVVIPPKRNRKLPTTSTSTRNAILSSVSSTSSSSSAV